MPDIFSFNDAVRVAANKYINASAAGSAVSGGVNAGSALALATGGCLPIGGSDGTLTRMLAMASNGYAQVYASGQLTTGVSGSGAGGVMVGGSDGTNYRHFSINASGALNINGVVAGGAAGASTDTGIRITGFDGANYRLLSVNGAGQLQLAGLTVNGSAHGTSTLLMAGSDGTNARALRTDTSGNVAVYEVRRSVFNNETTTNLGISATFTGTARDTGTAAGSNCPFAYFNAFFIANQTGTASIEASNDNTTWFTVATAALAVSTPLSLQIPVTTRYYRVKLVNGATAQTSVFVNSSLSAG